MRFTPRSVRNLAEILTLVSIAAGCAGDNSPAGASPYGGSGAPTAGASGTGGSRSPGGTGGTGGAPSTGGSGGSGSAGTGGSGGSGGSAPVAGSGGTSGTGGSTTADASGGTPDTSTTPTTDGGSPPDFGPSTTPMGTDGGGPQPSYAGEIPIYYGPPVGPIVQMNCPEDPTAGWTEYQDSFHIERPYNVPINTRFSIIGGIYTHWVFPNDRPHSTQAMGRNPRTEATYGGTYDKANVKPGTGVTNNIGYFTKGQRMYSADMLIEPNAVGSAFMQIHTTAAGGGPIGIRMQGNGDIVNNGSQTVVQGNSVPGGLVGKWFNFKASLNADTLETKIYVNNCLKSTYKGDRGDGNFYFKNGVYFCKNSPNGCFTHYKNIHLYTK
jgi:hypothetical protein